MRVRPRPSGAALLLATALLPASLGACSSGGNSLADQAQGNARYVPGAGGVEQIAPASRTATLTLSGRTVDGGSWSTAKDGAGQVVVVNVWGSWCPPCVAETPVLQKTWAAYQQAGKPVAFVGVDTMESSQSGGAFLTAHGVTFPSINDRDSDGAPVVALAGLAPATPSTLVLDRQGRVAARVSGPVTEITLRTLVDAVLTES